MRSCKWLGCIAGLFLVIGILCSCGNATASDDIIILYTNDVHCEIDGNIGYAGIAEYKEEMLQLTPYVTLVDCGDAIQGAYLGQISQGAYIIEIMNRAGYDYAVLGNHEFDYGMDSLKNGIAAATAQYLTCNIDYLGHEDNALANVKPYEIVTYGDTSVAYLGITTPWSVSSASPSCFMEDGMLVYDFKSADNGVELFDTVQFYVDECRALGVDYIVALAHLGDSADYTPFSSVELAKATDGIDVILDGHAHSTIPCLEETNKEGESVLISSTGSRFANIGKLVIRPDGTISTELISEYSKKDEEMCAFIEKIQEEYEAVLSQVIAVSEVELSVNDEAGNRIIRKQETNLGDLCADAYRIVAKADIGLANGGGIRSGICAGNVTYEDLFEVYPFGNALCTVRATGQEILDCLEMSCRKIVSDTANVENKDGEFGGFLQVSGLKFCIDSSVESPVIVDENEMFVRIEGERRVRDVLVLVEDGGYVPIDKDKIYLIASNDYLLIKGGDGYTMFMDNEFPVCEELQDYQVLRVYISEYLDGIIDQRYEANDMRITN